MKNILLTILFILFVSPVWGATYYVTQSGTGDGSSYANADSIADFNAGAFGTMLEQTLV